MSIIIVLMEIGALTIALGLGVIIGSVLENRNKEANKKNMFIRGVIVGKYKKRASWKLTTKNGRI